MSDKTGIEWTEATWNPVTGCSKVSQGCKHCYAEREWPRLSAPRPKPNIYTGRAFTDVMCHPEKLGIPLRWTKPRMIFVNSMSDLFHESVPDEFILHVFHIMAAGRHTFQVLTKRPERMMQFLNNYQHLRSRPLPNVWLGVSVEDQATADERIPLLLQTPAAVRWISAEPLLGPINFDSDLRDGLHALGCGDKDCSCGDRGIDWLVVGGESGPQARPMHPDWVRSLRDQCQSAGVPFFFKQWGEWVGSDNAVAINWPLLHREMKAAGKVHIWPAYMAKPAGPPHFGMNFSLRVGKKDACSLLDGCEWKEYPT